MIDRLALVHVKNVQLRILIVVLWNLSGLVLMWHLMFRPELTVGLVALVGGFMVCTALFLLAHTDWKTRKATT